MEHSSDHLDHVKPEQTTEQKDTYTPRPKSHLVGAWILIAVVLFAFLGMCYWMAAYGRV